MKLPWRSLAFLIFKQVANLLQNRDTALTGAGHASSLNHTYNSIPANSCWLLNCESNSPFNYTQTHSNWQLITTSGLQSEVLGVVVWKCCSLYTWASIETNKNHSFLRYTGFLNVSTEQNQYPYFCLKYCMLKSKAWIKLIYVFLWNILAL